VEMWAPALCAGVQGREATGISIADGLTRSTDRPSGSDDGSL
jgi:hypothetical protein